MPYACARAICATFCAHISGALIPLFGPSFPSLCVPLESSDYGRHVISTAIIKKAAEEAEKRERKEIEDIIKRGDPDEIKANFKRFTASDCEFLNKKWGSDKETGKVAKEVRDEDAARKAKEAEKAAKKDKKSSSEKDDSDSYESEPRRPSEKWWKSSESTTKDTYVHDVEYEDVSDGRSFVSDLLGLPAPKETD